MKYKCAVYIMSCDATKDVAIHMIKSMERYFIDLPYDIYIGVNKDISHLNSGILNFVPLESREGGWKQESIEQIKRMREIDPDITHVILILDDFVFSKKIDNIVFENLITQAMQQDFNYLRMKKSQLGVFQKICFFFTSKEFGIDYPVYKIARNDEYYSSLQVALWDLDYLFKRINLCENIWEFEQGGDREKQHYAVGENILNYTHIVEKGKWDFGSKSYCEKNIGFFDPASRQFRSHKDERWQVYIISLVIFLFGYTGVQFIRSVKKYFGKK
jgi:hypothetical protein